MRIENSIDAPERADGTAISGRRRAMQAVAATLLGLVGIETATAKRNNKHGSEQHDKDRPHTEG